MKFKNILTSGLLILVLFTGFIPLEAQKVGLESINIPDLESHMYFLASDELKGRATGEPGLLIAGQYLASQAKLIGLSAVDDNEDYYQDYVIEERSYDLEKCQITIKQAGTITEVLKDDFFMLPPGKTDHTTVTGEVVFAGYGITSEMYNYDDFAEIDASDKLVLIMNRAPMDEYGLIPKFEDADWNNPQNIMLKMRKIMAQQPKAILLVMDPKSGMNSLIDESPQIANFLRSVKQLKDSKNGGMFDGMPVKIIIVHRNVADKLLEGTGVTLSELQHKIDDSLEPHSFLIKDKTISVDLYMKSSEFKVPNVFGVIEGSDPVLKDEYVIYMAHYDHVGTDGMGGIFNGADDNASGSVGLLEIAEAFMKEKKKPKRSIGFLWVSGEEIGLFGSRYYAENPVIPLEKTVAVINLDMIGRIRTPEDKGMVGGDKVDVYAGDTVGVIGGLQSKVLADINSQTLAEMNMTGDYTHNRIDHPQRYFYRSDHISFARKDIPVLFYSTGTHVDYHQTTDTADKIDFPKFYMVTRFVFKTGFNVANYKGEIIVDNPFTTWGQ